MLFSFKQLSRFILFIFVLAIFYKAPLVIASISYTVTPLVINEEVEKRDIIEKKITITNTGAAPVTVYPSVNNISIDEGGGIQDFLPPVMSDQTSSLASWIEISRAGIDIKVGESKTVTMTIRVNPNPQAGEYHAFIGFGNGRNRDEAEVMVKQGSAPGTIVSVSFQEKQNTLLKLSHFVVDRFITRSENTSASYVIKNPGDEILTPTGEIIFYDKRGVEVGSLPVNPEKLLIGPGEEKSFAATVPTEGLFGKYKAFLSVEYGTANLASVQDTAFFYVLPLRTIIIMLGLILIFVIVISFHVHRKYFDEGDNDDSDTLPLHVREKVSDPLHHDIDLRNS